MAVKTTVILSVIALMFIPVISSAQDSYNIDNSHSIIRISGTSNVHDWEMEASGMTAKVVINGAAQSIEGISWAELTLPSENIRSHNNIMDKKTWEALKTHKYKSIQFELSRIDNLNSNNGSINGIAEGSLRIAGKRNQVKIPFTGEYKANNQLLIKGNKKITLKDYGISPPTAMMGTLKTGENINIDFNLIFIIDNHPNKTLSSK